MIPEAAVEAAISAMLRTTPNLYRLSADVLARAALEAAAPHMLARDASADVAAAFANAESAKRTLVARAAGVDPEVARSLGY